MTVLDEVKNMNKYHNIVFVEFLDMLCRVSIVCITLVDSIDYKCELLLKLIYDKYYKMGVFDSNDTPF